jgi:hypothetical protein
MTSVNDTRMRDVLPIPDVTPVGLTTYDANQRARTKPRSERKAMIDRTHRLSVTRQARLLALSRASVYYTPAPLPAADLALMRRIDELHLELPFAGSRLLRDLLRSEAVVIGREHVRDDIARTRSSRTCSAHSRSPGRITCGPPTSRTSPWPAASSTSSW